MIVPLLLQRYFFSARHRSLVRTIGRLSFLGVAVGIFALIVVLAVMNGFNRTLKERLINVEPHLVVEGRPDGKDVGPQVLGLLAGDASAVVTPFARQDVVVRSEDGTTTGAILYGVPASQVERLVSYGLPQGVSVARYIPGAGEVIVGRDLSGSLAAYEGSDLSLVVPETLLQGSSTTPRVEKVRVVATFETGLAPLDSKTIIYVLGKTASGLESTVSRRAGVEVVLADPWQADEWKDRIQASGLRVESWGDRNSAVLKSLKVEKMMVTLFVSLSTLIAGFSIFGVLSLLLTQKRKDLGILMALGMSRKSLIRTYTRVGLGLASTAVISGAVLGCAVCWALDRFPLEVLPPIYQDRTLPADLDWGFVALVTGVALVLSWVVAAASTRAQLRAATTPVSLLRPPGR